MQLNKTSKIIVILFFTFGCSYSTFSQFDKAKTTIDETYAKLVKKNKVVGASIAIVDKGEIVYAEGFGYTDQANNIKATPASIYKIASITKTFTAISMMQLQEKGLLDINESIKKYIPELTIASRFEDENEIYIKDILTHTSGLPSDILNGMLASEIPDLDWMIQELNKQQTASPKNYYLSYSNVGYGLLGLLIERVSGLSYADYMQQNIFSPLEMINSFGTNDNPENLSKGYANKEEIPTEKSMSYGASSISSSALDLANFTQMMIQNGQFKGKRILSEASVAAMENNWQVCNTLPTAERHGYGIDFRTISIEDEKGIREGSFLAHSGDEVAFHAVYGYVPELEVGAVILTNTDKGGWIRSASQLLMLYLKETKGITMQFADKDLVFDKTLIPDNEIVGHYNLGSTVLKMENTDKAKFKIEGVKATLTKKENSNDYGIKVALLGFLPIKIKDVIFRFEKRNNQIYLIQVEADQETGEYLSVKTEKQSIPTTWKKQLGNYKIVNAFPSSAPDFDFTNATVQLYEDEGWCVLEIKTALTIKNYLNIQSDTVATTGGIGRQAGTIVKILENGNLYFSGFEMERIGE